MMLPVRDLIIILCRRLPAGMLACAWFYAGPVISQNVDMNKITQQDINAVSTTTSGAIMPNNVIMNPNAKLPAVNQASQQTTAATPADTEIVTAILSRLSQEQTLASSNIQAACHEGEVTLTGTASSMAQISNAINLAKSIPGVKTVTSRIVIKGTGK
ncbi:hypothetical protein AQUSIP_09330 [Aquicella siphonis]|uniref:BON domain-containing protein n=1 Tax=Aquicella siphonis TaxID=254247 RepID=A0A5E4PH11_9COXI|nr:BON domain-containing protein [Aquicella siphonis]VVC75643.1 hypothetical protein AQUSIP_09330 [Aquicella siphonis]